MKLTFDQIKSILHGAVRTEEKDGRLFLYRFTEAQVEAYKGYKEDFYIKTFASAAMRLEFMTESKSLYFSADVKRASSRTFYAFDVYVNGALRYNAQGTYADDPYGQIDFNVDLGEGEKRVAIYLPWSAGTMIKELSLDDGATATPIEKSLTMISFGDSITQGYIAHCPSFTYVNRLADVLEAEVINKGIGGEVFFPTLAGLRDDIEPDIITVAYGTNDWSHSEREVFDTNSKLFYEALAKNYPNARIFALAPIWRPNYNKVVKKVGDFSHVLGRLHEIASNIPNMTVINCFDYVPKEKTSFAPDYLHPNDRGFFQYASNLVSEIKKHL